MLTDDLCNFVAMINQQDITELRKLIDRSNQIVITAHKSPDGDSIGSSMGWALVLKKMGKQVSVVFPDAFADYLSWVPFSDQIIIYDQDPDLAKQVFGAADLFFALDYNAFNRIGKISELNLQEASFKKVMIDHHRDPKMHCDLMFSYSSACATAELIYMIIDELNELDQIDKDIASCLYTGIMTDTGSFRFSSTTSLTHKIVADLLDKGANQEQIHSALFDQNTFDRLALLGYMLNNKMQFIKPFNTVLIALDQQELSRYNFKKGDTEGFVNYGLSIKGCRMVAFVSEKKDGVRVSFRSKADMPVNELAGALFGGGGHKNAAGAKGLKTVEQTIEKIKSALPEYAQYLS